MLGGPAVFIISLVDISLAKTVVPTTLAGIVVPATFVWGYKVKNIRKEQAGAELGQAQLLTGIFLYFDYHLFYYID